MARKTASQGIKGRPRATRDVIRPGGSSRPLPRDQYCAELLDSASEAIIVGDNDGRIVLVNRKAEEMFGYKRQELLGQSIQILVPERLRDIHAEHIKRYLASPRIRPMGLELDIAGRRKDGTEFPLECGLGYVETEDGVLVIAVMSDITGRRRAEEALRESEGELRRLTARLLDVQEEERRAIARELHDEIGQLLTGLSLTLETCVRSPRQATADGLRETQRLVDELISRVSDMSLALRPAMLDDLGLLPALLWQFERYTSRTGVRVDFKHNGLEGRLAPEVETAAYRIVQEALTNVARHAGVSETTVRVWADRDTLLVRIEDQGSGFDPAAVLAAGHTSGLAGMQERAALCGGQLTVDSAPGAGTRLTVEMPAAGTTEQQKR